MQLRDQGKLQLDDPVSTSRWAATVEVPGSRSVRATRSRSDSRDDERAMAVEVERAGRLLTAHGTTEAVGEGQERCAERGKR